ncbi:MAG TPA: translation initiation factor IF-2, partial [Anaerolineae bacterium]|nr:translation initiation factor IF-2 [Anaerolineae bacterium]
MDMAKKNLKQNGKRESRGRALAGSKRPSHGRRGDRQPPSGRGSSRGGGEQAQQPTSVEIPEAITVRDLATKMRRSPIEIIKVLMNYGIMAPITQVIDFDTASIVGEELGVEVR